MQKLLSLLLFIIVTMGFMKDASAETYPPAPKPDEVAIYYIGVEIPLNKILLIRKENQYCALKFINAWIEIDEERLKVVADDIRKGGIIADVAMKSAQKKYATYESYYERDGAANFTDGSILREARTASLLPLRGPFRPFIYQPGNGCIECGPIKLLWFYKTIVAFIPLGKSSNMRDFGIELAPTPWTDIKEVNIKDPRVKWYRYDEKRERVFITIDKLWEETGKKSGTGGREESGTLVKK